MWEVLEQAFEEIYEETGRPYSRQGSYGDDEELPETFYTFWNQSSELDGWYGNKASKRIWEWNIFYYTSNPELIYSGLDDFLNKAKSLGFIIKDSGRDITTGEVGYYGRFTTISFVEIL